MRVKVYRRCFPVADEDVLYNLDPRDYREIWFSAGSYVANSVEVHGDCVEALCETVMGYTMQDGKPFVVYIYDVIEVLSVDETNSRFYECCAYGFREVEFEPMLCGAKKHIRYPSGTRGGGP